MNAFNYLEAAGGVIAIAGLVFAAFRHSAVKIWRENAEAQKERADRLEAAVARLDKKIGEQEAQLAALREIVSGAHAIAVLSERIESRFDSLELAIRGR